MIQGKHLTLTPSIFHSFIVGILQQVPSLFCVSFSHLCRIPYFSKAATPSLCRTTSTP